MNHCMRHYEEPKLALCRTCQRPFCRRCLVFSFGPAKPPYCVGCALSASGVRAGGRRPSPAPSPEPEPVGSAPASASPLEDRRLVRARRRAEKVAGRAARKAVRRAGETGPAEPTVVLTPAPRATAVPAPSTLTMTSARDAVSLHRR